MGIQTATTGNLENAQNIVIAMARFTMEHNMPCVNLIERFQLGQGNKQLTIPKVSTMDAADLTDGVDMISSEDIGLSTTDLTAAEVGLKVILTDKLLRQFNEDVFSIIGRQMGDGMARKADQDVITLFASLNGGTVLGGDNKSLGLQNAANCVVRLTAEKVPPPYAVVHHPNAIGYLSTSAVPVAATYYSGILQGYSEELLRNFWGIRINGVNFFHDGNIEKISGYDSGYGAIFGKAAMAFLEAKAFGTERERDASMRAWEVVVVSDYGVFEIDDGYGFPMQYEIGNLATNN